MKKVTTLAGPNSLKIDFAPVQDFGPQAQTTKNRSELSDLFSSSIRGDRSAFAKNEEVFDDSEVNGGKLQKVYLPKKTSTMVDQSKCCDNITKSKDILMKGKTVVVREENNEEDD